MLRNCRTLLGEYVQVFGINFTERSNFQIRRACRACRALGARRVPCLIFRKAFSGEYCYQPFFYRASFRNPGFFLKFWNLIWIQTILLCIRFFLKNLNRSVIFFETFHRIIVRSGENRYYLLEIQDFTSNSGISLEFKRFYSV